MLWKRAMFITKRIMNIYQDCYIFSAKMERPNNDSECNYAHKNLQRTSDDYTLKENQLPMETPNDVQSSGNLTPTDDLSPCLSEDRSPMVTPNTTQDWTNEGNPESTTHQDKANNEIRSITKHNLRDVTQDFTCLQNAEDTLKHPETITESSISQESERSSFTEDQPQETMEDEPTQLPFELLTAAVPGIEEEKIKTLFAELPNSVRKYENSAHEGTTKAEVTEENIRSWVDVSMLKKHGDSDWERPSRYQRSKTVHSDELKPDAEEIQPRHDTSTKEKNVMQPITVKFLINKINTFTSAFEVHTYMKEVKATLSRTFQCQPSDLQLFRNGAVLSDNLEISELGVEPYGTVEIEIKSKGFLKTENMYDVPIVPDVITVRVESANEEVRDIVVEIESRCIRKPFVGGYRHKTSGAEYHHAFTQTPPLHLKVSAGGKRSCDTQTAERKEQQQNTTCDVATQMYKADHYVPSRDDRILEANRYIEADEFERLGDLNARAVIIQRHWMGYMARKRFAKMKMEHEEYLKWDREEILRSERELDEQLRKETARKIFPRTRADYEMLYATVENWRKAEVKRISNIKIDAEKKAEFCLLLKKEIESLNTIERHRLELKKEKLAKKELSIIEKCATPITWLGSNGKEVSMETVHIQRAKELKELYYIMCKENVTAKERIELLMSLKYVLKSYNPKLTNELISLFERECNSLMHGVKAKDLATLRQRTQKLFIELMKDPEFNPEAAKHVAFDWKGNEGKMHFCRQCQRFKVFNEFSFSAKTQTLEKCISCAWTDETARSRNDLESYRFMIRALRREERRLKCFSSLAFIMQDKDFYNLIVNMWQCHSPLSEEADPYKLCLGRWDVTKDWTPWNCVILTNDEMRAHVNVKNIKEVRRHMHKTS
ncbi:IQ and ubiquitin-like domain-containing protein isoform X4 [Zootermopsis nevadensis]|uniref:IQ and ubiquitin-like domain-containing protein isoform X4 n=1 Tax=Zootermopsis nevadensis TaxID=136037 RepID=UPI000B8EC320|nr:IQ and ubiquitin-like domain-containing protein isoform X4 [Zootermopsis nevadensis]